MKQESCRPWPKPGRRMSGLADGFAATARDADVGGEVEVGELQKLDRLQELRRHHQGLALAHLEPDMKQESCRPWPKPGRRMSGLADGFAATARDAPGPLQQRITLELGIDVGGEVEVGELQKLDRLQELRRQGWLMGLLQRLEMRQGQALVMTPQLLQAIKLLQLLHVSECSFKPKRGTRQSGRGGTFQDLPRRGHGGRRCPPARGRPRPFGRRPVGSRRPPRRDEPCSTGVRPGFGQGRHDSCFMSLNVALNRSVARVKADVAEPCSGAPLREVGRVHSAGVPWARDDHPVATSPAPLAARVGTTLASCL
jgi:hypothetical protein